MTAKRIWLWVAMIGALLSAVLLSPRTPEVGASTGWANAVRQSTVSTEEGQSYPLALGAGNARVGEVIIRHDSTHLYVEFKTEATYSLGAAHVCASVSAFGWTSPGRCPYTQSSLPAGTNQYTFAIPLAEIGAGCGARVSLQAHASIIGAASESLGGAYAGAFKGQVTYAVNCCGNNVCDLRAGEDATTCPSDCRWDSDNTTLPRGAELVSPEQFREMAEEDGFNVITRAALEAELAAERKRTAAARKLVDDLAASNPRLSGLKPTEPREQPWLRRLGDGNYRLTLGGDAAGGSFIVHGTDWMYQEIANSLTRTPSRANQEAIYRSLIDLIPSDRTAGLPSARQLTSVNDSELGRHNQELARRVEMFVPNEPINTDVGTEPRLASLMTDSFAAAAEENPGTGCDNHHFDSIYSELNWPLKPFTTRIRNQGERGTCVAFATTAGLETRIWRLRGVPTNYSEQELYATAKGLWFPTSDYYGDGLSIGPVLDKMIDQNYKLDAEARWRYNRSVERVDNKEEGTYEDSCVDYEGFCSDTNHQMELICTVDPSLICAFKRPPEVLGSGHNPVRLTSSVSLWNPLEPENSLSAIRAQLNAGRPVVMGLEIDDHFRSAAEMTNSANAGVVHEGNGGAGETTGHGVLVVGYLSNDQLVETGALAGFGGGYLIAKNSWGCAGDGGYMYLSYDWTIDQAKSAYAVIGVNTSATLPSVTLGANKSVLSLPGTVRVTAAVNAAATKVEIFQGLGDETPVLVKELPGGSDAAKSVDLNFTSANQNGVYLYWARVRDQFGNKVVSNIVGVNVNLDGAAPQVQLEAASTSVVAPGTVTLQANASDNVGVAKVKFFRGFQLLAEDHTAPYTLTHSVNLADLGTANYVALAYDTTGNFKMSNPISVNVLAAPKPFVLAFSASPVSLGSAGGQVTLSWNVAGASIVQISPAVGAVAAQGSTTVAVAQTTTFVLSATSSSGVTSTATAVVSVAPLVSPLVFEFKASPTTLPAGGGASTLSWNVIGSQMQLFIDGIGEVTGLTSKEVITTQTKTYTLTATNAGGTVTRQVTVTVNRETSVP